jgi:hypothetical protein
MAMHDGRSEVCRVAVPRFPWPHGPVFWKFLWSREHESFFTIDSATPRYTISSVYIPRITPALIPVKSYPLATMVSLAHFPPA